MKNKISYSDNPRTVKALARYHRVKAAGWRAIGTVVPPEVYLKVLAYKNEVMKQWRASIKGKLK